MTSTAETLHPLGSDALAVRRIRVLLEALVAVVVAVGAFLAVRRWTGVELSLWALLAVVVAVAAVAWWWAGVDHARWSWRLTSDLFEVRQGVLIRKVHLVPRSRIQNVTTTAGPLQRRYGVVTLTVHTAGARTRNVSVEDLDAGHAEAVRRRLGLA